MQKNKQVKKTVALIVMLALTVTFTQLMQLNSQKVKAQELPDLQVSNEDSRESMIITASDGNHIVLWGGTGYYSGNEKKIHAQKINGKTNQPMWGESGVIVTGILNNSDSLFESVKILPDNDGGAYILYKKDYNNNRSYHIYHIDTNGEPDDGWITNLGSAEINIDSEDFVAGVPEVIINNDGNVMVAYSYKYMYVNYIKVKIIDGETGDIINNSDPIDFVSGLEMQTIRLILNEDGSFFITYINGGNSVIEARKFNMDGSVGDEFEGPAVISTSVDTNYRIISDNNNGLYIIYIYNFNNNLYITHLIADGSIGDFNQEELYEPNVIFLSSVQAIINSEGTIFITFIDDTSKFGIPVFHMIKIDSSGNIQDSVIHEKGIPDRYSKRYMVDNEDGGIYVIYAVNDSYDEEKWIVQLANIKRDGTKDVRYFGLETVYEDAWESNTLLNVSYKSGNGAITWLGKKEGSSYKYVYANAFTASSSESSGGNPCEGLGEDQQCGVLEITGTTDIFFEGYDPEGGGSIPSATFKQISSSATDQTTTLDLTSGGWTADQFIGILDLEEGNEWSLQITGPTTFETSGGEKEFIPTTLKVATSAHEFGVNPLVVSDINSNSFSFTTHSSSDTENQNLLYWINSGSGYTHLEGDIEAPLNMPSSTNWESEGTFTTEIKDNTEDILTNAQDDGEVGVFGIGVNFLLGVPGNTTSGSYTGTITYTLL